MNDEKFTSGLRDVSGAFSGSLDLSGDLLSVASTQDPVAVYFYGPDPDLPWWKRWFYRARERLRGTPYPTIVIASGSATFDEPRTTGDGTVTISGSFRNDGTLHL